MKKFEITISEKNISELKEKLLDTDVEESELQTDEGIIKSAFGLVDLGRYGEIYMDKKFTVKEVKK